jgi:large subunit ribosomal protein L21
MAKIAVIKTGGKQYKVTSGQQIKVEKLPQEVGETLKFETLLVTEDTGENMEIGKPSLGERVEGKVVEHGKNKKVTVVKYKNKTRYTRTIGHRQEFTKIEISQLA